MKRLLLLALLSILLLPSSAAGDGCPPGACAIRPRPRAAGAGRETVRTGPSSVRFREPGVSLEIVAQLDLRHVLEVELGKFGERRAPGSLRGLPLLTSCGRHFASVRAPGQRIAALRGSERPPLG